MKTLILTFMLLILVGCASTPAAHQDGEVCVLPAEIRAEFVARGSNTTPWVVMRGEQMVAFAKVTEFQGEVDEFWLTDIPETGKTYAGVMVHGCLTQAGVFYTDRLYKLLMQYGKKPGQGT